MFSFKDFLFESKNSRFWDEANKLREKYIYISNNVEDWEYDGKYSALEMARYVNSEYKNYKKDIAKLLKKHFGDEVTVYRTSGLFGSGKKSKMVSVSLNSNYGETFIVPTKKVVFIGGESEEELIVDSKDLK